MTIEEIRTLIGDPRKTLPKKEFEECLAFFDTDSDGPTEYISEFINFYFIAMHSDESFLIDAVHLCNQKYIANIQSKPALKSEHLPYLYLKEIDYYTAVDSYSECIRYIDKIADLESAPPFCTAAAFSRAIDIFISCGLKGKAEYYVDRTRFLSNFSADITDRHLMILDCNLMHAYACMGKRKEYEAERKNVSSFESFDFDPEFKSLSRLYVLGSEAIIDSKSLPSLEYLREFCDLMENGFFSSSLTAAYAEVVVPILKWVKGQIPIEKLIRYTLHMIEVADTFSDKIEMYKVLIDDFKVEKPKYSFVYDEYHKVLEAYYSKSINIHRHEVIDELMSIQMEKEYKKKALTDELTGLGNRAAYEAELEDIVMECDKDKIPPSNLTILAMDVNGLKYVNDTFGHSAGDGYIIGAASCLKQTVGNYGHIYRTGGDEFMAIVRQTVFPADDVIMFLRKNLSDWTDNFGNHLSMAVGFAKANEHQTLAIDELVHLADTNMYTDKDRYYVESGRDRRKR